MPKVPPGVGDVLVGLVGTGWREKQRKNWTPSYWNTVTEGCGSTCVDTELWIFSASKEKQQNTSIIKAFTLERKLLLVLFLCKQQVLLLIQNNTKISTERPCYHSFFLYKIELLFIKLLCYSVILSQASSHTGFSVSVPMTTSLLFFSCLPPPLPPLLFKSRRKQRKACVASCLSLSCVGAFVITSSKVRTGGTTTDVTDAQSGCVRQTAGAANTRTLKNTISLWGGGLEVLGNWVVYCLMRVCHSKLMWSWTK